MKCKGRGRAKGFGCGLPKDIEKGKLGLCNDCFPVFLAESPHGQEMVNKKIAQAHREQKVEQRKKEKAERAERTRQKEAVKTLNDLKKELQTLVNFIVRSIDYDKGCISCGHGWDDKFTRQRQAGHYHDKHHNGGLRFMVFNIYVQCTICNDRYSANIDNYRKGIIKHYGQELMDFIDSLPSKYGKRTFTPDELRKCIETAKMIKKDILSGRDYTRMEVNSLLNLYK
jgi:hypothetical protein